MKTVTVNEGHSVWAGKDRYPSGSSLEVSAEEAERLIKKGVVTESADDGVIAKSEDPEKLTVPELKKLLDKLEIEYPAKATKPELLDLIKKKTAPPPEDNE